MHWPGRALTCWNLVPHSFTSWSHQKWLWPQNGPIWALLAHLEGLWHLRWPLLIREMVSMHRPGHALTCCNLVPHSSTSLEPPEVVMATKWPNLGPFGPLRGPMAPPMATSHP